MKKTTLMAVALMTTATVHADEGMWTLYNLPGAVFEQMKTEGFAMPYASIYEDKDAIKNAVVNFGGYCSGVVVSADGLLFTNHHCGFEAIRSHSTVEHDYMLNGFYAKDYKDELPNKNLFVSFMVEQKDITALLDSLGIYNMMPSEQDRFLDSLENVMSKEVSATDSTLRLEIKPFYEGNKYFATTYRDFRDVRLVFTVPKSMGKYGGETDNWMWPRQTCDFSVFRIYADPVTNGPADYNEKNVPYHPQSWAKVSMDGYKEGDFAMTIGYPGSTSRYLSSYGIRERRDAQNEPTYKVRGIKQDVMIKHMRADEAVRIKYDSKYARSSNYWKNSIGMNKCIDSTQLIAHKTDFETRIKAYQDSTGYLKGKLDFDLMRRLYDKRLDIARAMTYFYETFYGTCELADRARRVHNGMTVEGPENKAKKQYVTFKDNSDSWDEALDKEVFVSLLQYYRKNVDKKYLPQFYHIIDTKFNGNYEAYVNHVWSKSMLMKTGKKLYINKKAFKRDLGVQMGLDILDIKAALLTPLGAIDDSIQLQERYLCDAKIRMEMDMPHYSDANFTMRLSYGQVGGFMLGGKQSGYYTAAPSIVSKMKQGDKIIDYFAEPIMHDLMSTNDFGSYRDKNTGDMHLCFLTNNDITGGNSGSPIFGDKGQLLGLAFDGNWDSLSGDIFFDSTLARCIGVDIRYMVYLMDKWGHADRLIKELGIEK